VDVDALVELVAAMERGDETEALGPKAAHLADRFQQIGWLGAKHDSDAVRKLRHWWSRGWHPSLSYYLWSRNPRYADASDLTGDTRQALLNSYLDSELPLPPTQIKGERISLPSPRDVPEVGLGNLLMRRRTIRGFHPDNLSSQALSSLLYFGLSDLRDRRSLAVQEPLDYLRSYGVAFDLYLIVYGVDDIQPGVYRYDIVEHCLAQILVDDLRDRMSNILLGMPGPRTAAVTVNILVDFPRYQWRYRHERALRHIYMASGRVAQRLIVVALAHGLGTLPTPATRDHDLCSLLGLDLSRQSPIYTLTMGRYRDAETASVPQ
jgi:SagB-type dehydrogenase family enzyme